MHEARGSIPLPPTIKAAAQRPKGKRSQREELTISGKGVGRRGLRITYGQQQGQPRPYSQLVTKMLQMNPGFSGVCLFDMGERLSTAKGPFRVAVSPAGRQPPATAAS